MLHVDDDGFLCLSTIVHNLVHAAPHRMFFWAKYFCLDGKVLDDENFMLMFADLADFLDDANRRGVLRASYEGDATFAAHFGLWQHMLNLTILDDRGRIDAQQGYLTSYMRRGELGNGKKAPKALLGGFCRQYVWSHHVWSTSVMHGACTFVEWPNSSLPFPKTGPFHTQVCRGHPQHQTLYNLSRTSIRKNLHFPVVNGGLWGQSVFLALNWPRWCWEPSWFWMGFLHSCTTTGTTWLP